MTQEQQAPELMSPDEVDTVILISDEECTPCQLVTEHLKKMEKDGTYPGTIQVIDPLSEEADRFYDNEGNIALPSALIKKKDGTEQACEIFMDKETLALQCEGKLLIINDAPQELLEQVEEMTQSAPSVPEPSGPVPSGPEPAPPVPSAGGIDDLPLAP